MAAQLPQVREHLSRFGDRLPEEIRRQLEALERGSQLADAGP